MLKRWLHEQDTRAAYDNTDALWITRGRSPYQSSALRCVLRRLCDIADIDTERRPLGWYALRHSTGTYIIRKEGLATAQTQLRHKSPETTVKYDHVPVGATLSVEWVRGSNTQPEMALA
jgi:site-specific recombinase XerD